MKLTRNLTPDMELHIELTEDEQYDAYFEVRRMMHERGIFMALERNSDLLDFETEEDFNSFIDDCIDRMIEEEQNSPKSDDDLYNAAVFNLAQEYECWKEA